MPCSIPRCHAARLSLSPLTSSVCALSWSGVCRPRLQSGQSTKRSSAIRLRVLRSRSHAASLRFFTFETRRLFKTTSVACGNGRPRYGRHGRRTTRSLASGRMRRFGRLTRPSDLHGGFSRPGGLSSPARRRFALFEALPKVTVFPGSSNLDFCPMSRKHQYFVEDSGSCTHRHGNRYLRVL